MRKKKPLQPRCWAEPVPSEADGQVFRLLPVRASTGVDVVMIFVADPLTILHPISNSKGPVLGTSPKQQNRSTPT